MGNPERHCYEYTKHEGEPGTPRGGRSARR